MAPICLELGGEISKRRRAFARCRTQMRDDICVVVKDEPHREHVHGVNAAPSVFVELCGVILDAFQANLVQLLRRIGCPCLVKRAALIDDSGQLRESARSVLHRA